MSLFGKNRKNSSVGKILKLEDTNNKEVVKQSSEILGLATSSGFEHWFTQATSNSPILIGIESQACVPHLFLFSTPTSWWSVSRRLMMVVRFGEPSLECGGQVRWNFCRSGILPSGVSSLHDTSLRSCPPVPLLLYARLE